MYTSLVQETRLKTLELYKSLLKASKPYDNLQNTVRQQFKSNKHTTSRKKTLALLTEADQTLGYLDKANSGDRNIVSKINAYIQKYIKPPKPLPKKQQKNSKLVERKPYQVAITTRHSFGFEFKRVRGWRQPVKTAMMLKNKVKTTQARIDKYQTYQLQLEMIKGERLFLKTLGCLPKDGLNNYEDNIKMAMTAYSIKTTQIQNSATLIPEEDLS